MKVIDILNEVKLLSPDKARGYNVIDRLHQCDNRFPANKGRIYDEEIHTILRNKTHIHAIGLLTDSQKSLMNAILKSCQAISGKKFNSIVALNKWINENDNGQYTIYTNNGSQLGNDLCSSATLFWNAIDHHSIDDYQQKLYSASEFWYQKFIKNI